MGADTGLSNSSQMFGFQETPQQMLVSQQSSQMFASQPPTQMCVSQSESLHSDDLMAAMSEAGSVPAMPNSHMESNGNLLTTSQVSDTSNTLMSDNSIRTCDLATFLIQRACRNPALANYLYWYLCIECENQDAVRKQDEQVKCMYEKVLKSFKRSLTMGKLIDYVSLFCLLNFSMTFRQSRTETD